MLTVRRHALDYDPRKKNPGAPIKVSLIQEQYPEQLIGRRAGEGIYVGRINLNENPREYRSAVQTMIGRIPAESDLAVISEHPGNTAALDLFQQQADEQKQLIIARLGYYLHDNSGRITNSIAVITPGHPPVFADQISFSTEDLKFHAQGSLHRGEEIQVLTTPLGNIGVISCHDYTNADILKKIFAYDIEMLVVSSFNPATRLFMQYALADIHRFSCFVIISNIANYGGSGVFAPFRYNGPKRASLSLGGALAYTQGETRTYLEVDLPISDLRRLRQGKSSGADLFEDSTTWTPIYPSEEFLSQDQSYGKARLEKPGCLNTVDLKEEGYVASAYQGEVVVGVVQLKSMAMEDYIENYYCISCSPNAPRFIEAIRIQLRFLAERLRSSGQKLDFLVFPELFLPLGLEGELKIFAREFNTIIIGGVEYDPQPEKLDDPQMARGVNRCFIYVPTGNGEVRRFQYDKLTRSQYDARTPAADGRGWGRFTMIRGDRLFRFVYGEDWAFSVLICYDYSHFDIVHRINRDQSQAMPPEMLFIVAGNPDSQLYERCCMADSHRYYQYIIMSNIAQYGGSGIYAPLKTPGRRQTLLNAGVGTEGISITTLKLAELQEARKDPRISPASTFQHKPGLFQMINADRP